MMNKKRIFLVFIVFFLNFVSTLQAQAIPKGNYLNYMELSYPRLTPQSKASYELQLYGDTDDPDYIDAEPRDGIDDKRYEILQDLAVKFAPYLVQNSTLIPMNFKKFMASDPHFQLYVDTWDIFGEKASIINSQTINFSTLSSASCDSTYKSADQGKETDSIARQSDKFELFNSARTEDCKLLALLQEFYPENPKNRRVVEKFKRQIPDPLKVLYYNFPGEGPETWNAEYIQAQSKALPNKYNDFLYSYVHPFIHTAEEAGPEPISGYELVLQYWFFYPFNDGGNNHEGDWEHINVVISPRNKVQQLLTAAEMQQLLKGNWLETDAPEEQLVIKRIEYYFHYDVMLVDFSSPNVYAPREEWQREVKERSRYEERLNQRDIWRSIREMAYRDDAEEEINTHPIGYIGADNKGTDQILQMPGPMNRDSHGTYPFAGIYKNIGPAGATEKIVSGINPHDFFEKLDAAEGQTYDIFKRGNVVSLAHPERVEIVPDWERVMSLVHTDAAVRREWSWLLLPIHWGYPATVSPFAGILKHTDTGNVPPITPSFGYGWNVSGPSFGYKLYNPHRLAALFPTGFQDNFENNLGFLNLTFPVFLNLPPLDFLKSIAAYPIRLAVNRPDPLYYPEESVPFSFVGLGGGLELQQLDKNFKALIYNDQQLDEFIISLLAHLITNNSDSTTAVMSTSDELEEAISPYYQMVFYVGDHFVSENTIRNFRNDLSFKVKFNNIPDYLYEAELNFWEYSGSIRYNLTTSRWKPFLKAGYGLSWYRLENVQSNGETFVAENSKWIRKPSFSKLKNFLPNTWHLGAGLEFFIFRNQGRLPKGFDLSLRADYTYYSHQLGLDLSEVPLDELNILFSTLGDVPNDERVTRKSFSISMILSF